MEKEIVADPKPANKEMTLAEQLQQNLLKLKKVDKIMGKEIVDNQVKCAR